MKCARQMWNGGRDRCDKVHINDEEKIRGQIQQKNMHCRQHPFCRRFYPYVYFQNIPGICPVVQRAYLSGVGKFDRQAYGIFCIFGVGSAFVYGIVIDGADIFKVYGKGGEETCGEEGFPDVGMRAVCTCRGIVFLVCAESHSTQKSMH